MDELCSFIANLLSVCSLDFRSSLYGFARISQLSISFSISLQSLQRPKVASHTLLSEKASKIAESFALLSLYFLLSIISTI